MAFNGSEGTFISISEGSTMTKDYRNTFLTGDRKRKAIFFGREKLMSLLDQADCVGIRCYFGAVEVTEGDKTWEELNLVLVGANTMENDQIGANHQILDHGIPCPMQCDTNGSPLNS